MKAALSTNLRAVWIRATKTSVTAKLPVTANNRVTANNPVTTKLRVTTKLGGQRSGHAPARHELTQRAPGGGHLVARRVGVPRSRAEVRDRRGRGRCPGVVEHAPAADWAGLLGVRPLMLESGGQEVRQLSRFRGSGSGERVDRRPRRAEPGRRSGNVLEGRQRDRDDLLQLGEPPVGRHFIADRQRRQRFQVPGLPFEDLLGRAGPTVGVARQRREQGRQLLLGQLCGGFGRATGVTEHPFGVDQDVEPEDRLQRIVHARRLAANQRPELRVGKERPVQLKRPSPAPCGKRLPFPRDRDEGLRVAEPGARRPLPGDDRRSRLTVLRQLDLDDSRVRLVQVPPAFLPHGGPFRPPHVVPGQRDLSRLREARLPRPVPPRDDRQPGSGLQVERDRIRNATKPLHPDRLQVDLPRRADLSLFVVLVNAAVPATSHCGEDQARDLIGNLIVGELRADDLRNTASLLCHVGNNTGIAWSSHEIP